MLDPAEKTCRIFDEGGSVPSSGVILTISAIILVQLPMAITLRDSTGAVVPSALLPRP